MTCYIWLRSVESFNIRRDVRSETLSTDPPGPSPSQRCTAVQYAVATKATQPQHVHCISRAQCVQTKSIAGLSFWGLFLLSGPCVPACKLMRTAARGALLALLLSLFGEGALGTCSGFGGRERGGQSHQLVCNQVRALPVASTMPSVNSRDGIQQCVEYEDSSI